MKPHFTPQACDFLRRAAALSANLGHGYLGVEHVLLAALALDEAASALALADAGLPAEVFVQQLHDEIVGYPQLGSPPGLVGGEIPVTPRLAAVLEMGAPGAPLDLPALLREVMRDPRGLPARLTCALGGDPAGLADVLVRLAQTPSPDATATPARLTISMSVAIRSRCLLEDLVDGLKERDYTLLYDPAVVGWLLLRELESEGEQGALEQIFAGDLRPRLESAMRVHPPGSVFSLALTGGGIDLLIVKGNPEA